MVGVGDAVNAALTNAAAAATAALLLSACGRDDVFLKLRMMLPTDAAATLTGAAATAYDDAANAVAIVSYFAVISTVI